LLGFVARQGPVTPEPMEDVLMATLATNHNGALVADRDGQARRPFDVNDRAHVTRVPGWSRI
jgi:hypothetical protein